MSFPILETERLILRQLRHEDAVDLFDYFSKDEVTEFYDLDSFTELKQAEELIENWNEKFNNSLTIRWGIALKSEGRIIGTCGFHKWVKKHFKAEIGYELSPRYWRQGYMKEAIDTVMKYGFEVLELNRIEALIHSGNTSSQKVLEKTGFKEEGLLKEYFYEKKRFIDAVIFSKLKKDNNNAR
ncbi:GNAT family N-acetyltransferase [Cohnella herbarum]|uniref:GNAT family N-acetyltransferase n=1 Tax=Cohnella herbarum TaxID=2728023 RepID=A0A7Z2VH51_9BACL|nr:GNAT family protein [Cohnella herbarum]QJD82784.1 GNAT family N-acetyltransferase [Cohnella herbarum]